MKKLIIMVVFSIVGFTTYAQEDSETQKQQSESVTQAQDDFTQITESNVPQAVKDAVKKYYPTAIMNTAYKNKSDQYKLEMTLEDGTTGILYFDKDGNSIDL